MFPPCYSSHLPTVPAPVTSDALVAHLHSYVPPLSEHSNFTGIVCPSLHLFGTILLHDPVFDGMGLVGFKSRINAFVSKKSAPCFFFTIIIPFSFLCYNGCMDGIGSSSRKKVLTLFKPSTVAIVNNILLF